MYCKNCGKEISEGAAFCGNCGAKQEQPAQPQTTSSGQGYSAQPIQQTQTNQNPQWGYPVGNPQFSRQSVSVNNANGPVFDWLSRIMQSKQNLTKYFAYAGIALLAINLLFLFLPVVEVYQPSYKETHPLLGTVEYKGWHTDTLSMVKCIIPIFLTLLPYTISLSMIIQAYTKGNANGNHAKSGFVKIINNTVDRPINFAWNIFGAIANVIVLPIVYSMTNSEISYELQEAGAYCQLTPWGTMSIVFSIVFIVLLVVLSLMSRVMAAQYNTNPTSVSNN